MKKIVLTTTIIICLLSLSSYLFGDIYPAPTDLTASKGEYADSIKVRWSAPTPPEFGEGFEAGIPEDWDTIATNLDYSWQIIDHPAYAHSGSYAACVPYTFSEGEFVDFGDLVTNGDFSKWIDTLPQYWHKSTEDIIIDSLAQDSLYLAFSAPSQTFRYVYQGLPVDKYAKYKLTFTSKQDSLEETYKIELYNKTDNKVLWSKKDLNNLEWETFEFDIHTSSCDSLEIRLYPSNQGNTTYWDNISFEKYIYETPNQDEWLISPNYSVKSGDELTFWLGTSKTYGVNSPVYVYVLVLQENETDTLLVSVYDGSDHLDGLWEYKEYSLSLKEFENSEIQIAFRYLGGNGDLVCLDDVSIGGEKRELTEFFVIPIKNPKVKFGSRAPVGKDSKSSFLSGYKLYRRMYHKGISYQIPNDSTLITDTTYIDTVVSMDTLYVYNAKAIYNNVIPSAYSNVDTGYVYDNSRPGSPYDLDYSADWEKGTITLRWHKPISLAKDLKHYYIYDNDTPYDSVEAYTFDENGYINSDKTTFIISSEVTVAEHLLETNLYKFSLVAKDFAGNYSDTTEVCDEIITPPKITLANKFPSTPYGTIKVTVSKWASDETCQPEDSIRIYRSTSDVDTTFRLVKVLTATSDFVAGKGVYTDSLVRTDSTYYYYATVTYDDNGSLVESFKSRTAKATPQSNIANISNLRISETTDTAVIFQWEEPDTEPLNYGGVYVYKGEKFTHPIDTVSVGDTTYKHIFIEPGITDFTFWPFDKYGVRWEKGISDLEAEGNIIKNVVMGLQETETEDFENGYIPENWDISPEDGDGIWQVSDDGSSQWFTIPDHEGNYAFVNDDILGQSGVTNCYLILPPITGLTSCDKVYLKFDSYFDNKYDGSAYLSIKTEDAWENIKDITEEVTAKNWLVDNTINLSALIDSSLIDSFRIAFHYDDKGTWSLGWAIDNVSILTTSTDMKTTLGEKIVIDAPFKIWTNYPNPFSQSTNFSFYLNQPATVSLEIYNILGQKVRTIEKGKEFPAGKNYLRWDGKTDAGKRASPGIYLYRIDVDGNSRVNKMMLLR